MIFSRCRAGAGARLWVLSLMLCASVAPAHIVYGTKTLHGLVSEAELVVHARILSSGERVALSTEEGAVSRPTVEAQVLDVLEADADFDGKRVRFVQHGHGVAPFEPGEETLLFLLPIDRNQELSALKESGLIDWVSLQEHDDAYPLRPGTREVLLGAVRDYVSAADAPPDEAVAALRRATLSLLTSGDAGLAASALRDLALAPGAPLIAKQDVPRLLPLLDDPEVSMGVRTALLAELARRGWVDADERWQALLAAPAATRDRVTAIRAAGASAGPALRPALVTLLEDPDAQVAAAAAAALGRPGEAAAVAPLRGALARDDRRVRMAALRGLGRIATPEADAALREAAASHPDADTRRRAEAELRKRAQR